MTDPVARPIPPGPRKAVDELARLVLAEEDRQSVLERAVGLVTSLMPAGAQASITVVRNRRPTTAAFTGELALRLDETQYGQGYGPCMDAALSGQFIEITDGRTEDRWPDYVATFLRHGALSSLSVPAPATQLAACVNVYSPAAGAFTGEHRQALAEFAAYAGVVLTNIEALQDARDQAENMRAALESRAAIEQAKGILMERHKLTPDQAFRLLADASMHTNRKVRDLAEQLVLTGELTPDPTPAGRHVAHRLPHAAPTSTAGREHR
ncbi:MULTISPECIES: ANTAR domain-containing protein [unclassified Blastococcus]